MSADPSTWKCNHGHPWFGQPKCAQCAAEGGTCELRDEAGQHRQTLVRLPPPQVQLDENIELAQAIMLGAISMGEWAQRLERREHARQTIRPVSYIAMLPHIVETGRALGYAIGVHGSVVRDLDLIAAPWVEDAAPAEELAEAIRGAVGGVFARNAEGGARVTEKPHGRRAWLFYCGSLIIDLSILPRSPR